MPLNRNLPNNSTNDSLLLTMGHHHDQTKKIADCVDTVNNRLTVDISADENSLHGLATETSLDSCASSLNDIKPNIPIIASRLNTIQNHLTQDGLGGGTSHGVMLDGIDSSLNTIESNSTLTASRLDNIQVDLAAIEILHTTTNTKLGTIETDIEITNNLITTLDTVADNILTKNTEIDTAVDAMSAKLPSSVGGKATSGSVSVARSTTTGDWDLSGRTTIATKGTSTKLLCDTAGHLQVDIQSQSTDFGIHTVVNGVTIANSANSTSSAITITNNGSNVPPLIFALDVGTSTNSEVSILESIDGTLYVENQTKVESIAADKIFSLDAMEIAVPKYFKVKISNAHGSGTADYTLKVGGWGLTFA